MAPGNESEAEIAELRNRNHGGYEVSYNSQATIKLLVISSRSEKHTMSYTLLSKFKAVKDIVSFFVVG